MRTAIYVMRATTLTIKASANEPAAQLVPYRAPASSQGAIGTHQLARGIYLVSSQAMLLISGPNDHAATGRLDPDYRVETSLNDKDGWPDPPQFVLELEKGATVESVKRFFNIAKDIDV
jgi:hypothetical protein